MLVIFSTFAASMSRCGCFLVEDPKTHRCVHPSSLLKEAGRSVPVKPNGGEVTVSGGYDQQQGGHIGVSYTHKWSKELGRFVPVENYAGEIFIGPHNCWNMKPSWSKEAGRFVPVENYAGGHQLFRS